MDEITKFVLLQLSSEKGDSAIVLTHQFLDGKNGKCCGFVPSNPSGITYILKGVWYGS